ncbi:MAG TPA: hypothetical protein VJ890_05905 [Vineibacter sp.]|nr:hypothetical protein [Vineibacter sp.]
MIAISLRDFRGCERADLIVDPLCLLAGVNAAGKSSVAQAVGAAASGNALPVAGLTKAMTGMLVRSGAANGTVELVGDGGTVWMAWPAAAARQEGGEPPQASQYAAGLSSVLTLPQRDRARVLSDVLKALPTHDDVSTALAEVGWAPERCEAAWKLIEEQGWDGAHAARRDRGAEFKGRWRQVTGANYGSRIAAAWRPDLADLDEGELIDAVREARAGLEKAQTAAAVSSVEQAQLRTEASLVGALTAAEAIAAGDVDRAQAEVAAAQEARAALPSAEQPATHPCPYCSEPIIVQNARPRLVKSEVAPLQDSELKARRLAIADADGKIAHAGDALNAARQKLAAAQAAVENARRAQERIAANPGSAEPGMSVEALRAEVARTEKRLAEYRTKVEADEINAQIERNEQLLEVLAGDGLRAKKLSRVLDVFVGRQLKALTDAAGWAAVTIDAEMNVSMGLPYPLLSKSEQYRVRAVFQVAMAIIDGSDLVVLDEADILDGPTRSGLFKMLDAATQEGLAALVCMTLSRKDQAPDLAAIGLGRSYWLEAGVAEPIGQEAQAA